MCCSNMLNYVILFAELLFGYKYFPSLKRLYRVSMMIEDLLNQILFDR